MQAVQRSISRSELPREALLRKYIAEGAYTDCYTTEITTGASFAAYVEAFYTTAAFKVERVALWFIGKPSSDGDARRLARGDADSFAAWSVEARAPEQLLLCDFLRRSRSWLMIAPIEGGARLYFGTGILPVGIGSGDGRLGFPFNALIGFHRLYSRILLGAARSRVVRLVGAASPPDAETERAELTPRP